MSETVDQLAQKAGQLAAAGRWEDAERVWLEVRRREPGHPRALASLGVHALQRNDVAGALDLLRAARKAAPADRVVLMSLAAACRRVGDAEGEVEAIDAALALEPYFLPALLVKAGWLERFGQPVAAAATFANCLKIAPPRPHWPVELRPQLVHAAEVVARHVAAISEYFDERLGGLIDALPGSLQGRWREALSIGAGRSRPFLSECNELCVPRLPAIPFFDRSQFSWAGELEARTDVIRAELEVALEKSRDRFSPYVAYRPGQPVNQWRELNHSDRWSSMRLWRDGEPMAENLERCPETARALERVSMAEIPGLCPNAMFSALAPHTRIPPHHGETNARVVVHLPLIVPAGCRYRVGFEQRQWRVGEILVFDDTLEHEAHNDGDELRVVLIFDVWNPLLEPAERELARALAVASREFPGAAPPSRG